jgi:hypothetical protein
MAAPSQPGAGAPGAGSHGAGAHATTAAATGDPPPDEGDKSLSDLLSTLTSQLSTLFRKEVELAQVEIKQEIRKAGKAAGALGTAGGAGYMAVLMLSFALAWGLGELIPVWAGFLIVGAIYAVVAAVMYSSGKKKLDQVDPKPEQTIDTLKEDAEWARARKS